LKKLTLTLATVLGMATSGAQAADFQKGLDAARAGNFEIAFVEFSALAEEGDADAQYNLALMYDNGQGVELDDVVAFQWYTLSAQQGHSSAQYNLASMYQNGRGVAEDDVAALKWYTLSAEQGDIKAQNNLAKMYFLGEGVAQNSAAALIWATIAAENGNENASAALNIVRKNMSQADIARAEDMARVCMESDYKNCDP